jgi:hypothetical protein
VKRRASSGVSSVIKIGHEYTRRQEGAPTFVGST